MDDKLSIRSRNIEEKFRKIENNVIIQSVVKGLTMAMPVLFIGSATLVVRMVMRVMNEYLSNPSWMQVVDDVTFLVYDATFGLLAVYMAVLISVSYMRQAKEGKVYLFGAPIASLGGFIIISGGLGEDAVANFGVRGMFAAIMAAIVASYLYRRLWLYFGEKRLFSEGADVSFNNALSCIFPMAITWLLFALVNDVIQKIGNVSNFQELFIKCFNLLFENMGRTLGSSLLFVFISTLLWFFGIHGSNVLDNVAQEIFVPGVEVNVQAIENGTVPTEIFSKNFFDVFVFMGGCGSLMCLLIAILLFSKRRSIRYLGRISAIPVTFNVNELIVIGMPVVLNPYLLIPFIATPLACTLTSAIAMHIGWVPVTTYTLDWTTPVLFSGYLATKSVAGCVLQLFNLIMGVAIYRPFLRLYDKAQESNVNQKINALVELLKKSEDENVPIALMEQNNEMGNMAKMIAMDLKRGLETREIKLYYQPQFNERYECIGAEALLRWNHMGFGVIYPPLVIKLAEEMGLLLELEKYVFQTVVEDASTFEKEYGMRMTFSINVSMKSLINPEFEVFLLSLVDQGYVKDSNICIEVTEQIAIRLDEGMKSKFERLHGMGYLLAIDDFAMGNTSLKYLQGNQFNIVKIDGSLVRNLNRNVNSEEIIKSILYLSNSLGFSVMAEYVESEELRNILEGLGCYQYQGYLFSQAVPYEELCNRINKN